MTTKAQLRKKYGALDIVEKKLVKSDYEFLRYQAHEVGTEDIFLPAVYKLRGEVSATVTTRRLVAFADTLEDLAQVLHTLHFPPMKEAA